MKSNLLKPRVLIFLLIWVGMATAGPAQERMFAFQRVLTVIPNQMDGALEFSKKVSDYLAENYQLKVEVYIVSTAGNEPEKLLFMIYVPSEEKFMQLKEIISQDEKYKAIVGEAGGVWVENPVDSVLVRFHAAGSAKK